jgi:hypothetical protein
MKPVAYAFLKVGFATALSITAVVPAQAVENFYAVLKGSNEVPANPSSGTGYATVQINDAMDSIKIDAVFNGLGANDVAAHIHCCALPTANAGVAIDSPNLPGFPTGVRSGTYAVTLNLLDALTYSPAFVTANGGTAAGAQASFLTALRGGRTYFNIHTTQFPGGEIRGNFARVPEPASWAMMIGGFGLVGAAMRRRVRFATI